MSLTIKRLFSYGQDEYCPGYTMTFSYFDLSPQQFDVKNIFLNSNLTKKIFVNPLVGFKLEGGKVCKLKEVLYGLKQSPITWFDRLNHEMREHRFKQAFVDHTLFYKRYCDDITLLIVYIDDIVITSNNSGEVEKLWSIWLRNSRWKDLGLQNTSWVLKFVDLSNDFSFTNGNIHWIFWLKLVIQFVNL